MARDYRIEYMRIDNLVEHFHPDNPKEHDLGGIDVAYDEFGFVEIPTLEETTQKIIAGHGRIMQLNNRMRSKDAELPDGIQTDDDGMWKMPVIRGISLTTPAAAQAYLLTSNKLTMKGGWDPHKLIELLTMIHNDEIVPLEATGFDEEELQHLIEIYHDTDNPDEFEEYDESIDTDYCCPKCGYEWSGSPR